MTKYSLMDFARVNGIYRVKGIINIQPLPDRLKQRILDNRFSKAGRCYDNVFGIVNSGLFDNALYVLAVASKVLPVQHAIIKIGECYFDPTWELNQSDSNVFDQEGQYLVIDEWDRPALNEIILKTQSSDGICYAPMISTIRKIL
ncbi:hypothetical protein GLP21_18440 [Photobacterium carnosum]|uniref:Uncharacterized protein n=2 Tax=Photobacterium carnosum TaxID=2023717 RepID=A0A2N4UWM2_9GAMM|nr:MULTISPECIES: hypothetical protein [Photobacterium]MCD9476328.1 hypothetical protein [Photobacterium phosphoreum]MCD9488075.1 hypothetical protein [Photobacterium iliopiscarium]MCD9508104.1 hypothetical protein [Photobacterium phosphoreum]MCD9539586.1 hypothetical protein [Photobacterium carnosum]MCD9542321.1 hypothetical protein [Photobacterium carnosum]